MRPLDFFQASYVMVATSLIIIRPIYTFFCISDFLQSFYSIHKIQSTLRRLHYATTTDNTVLAITVGIAMLAMQLAAAQMLSGLSYYICSCRHCLCKVDLRAGTVLHSIILHV